MSDLTRSLRKAARLLIKNVDSYIKIEETLPYQAADLIEQQRARIAELEANVERLREACTKAVEQVPEVACILGFAKATQMKSRAILNAIKREVYVAGYMDGYNRSLQPTSTMFSQNDQKKRATQYANKHYPDKG